MKEFAIGGSKEMRARKDRWPLLDKIPYHCHENGSDSSMLQSWN